MARWYLAVCRDCRPVLPQPFRDEAERDEWAQAHRTTGHTVELTEEERPDAPEMDLRGRWGWH